MSPFQGVAYQFPGCVPLNTQVQVLQARIPVAFSMEKQLLKAKEDQDFRHVLQRLEIGWGCCGYSIDVFTYVCIFAIHIMSIFLLV